MGYVLAPVHRIIMQLGVRAPEELLAFYWLKKTSSDEACIADAMVSWFEKEQGLFPKLAQGIAERPDAADEITRNALRKLQTHCPPTDFSQIKAIIQADMDGGAITRDDVLLSDLVPEPLGTGSVAQVHRCGDDKVVKVALLENRQVMIEQAEYLEQLASLPVLSSTPLVNMAQFAKGILPGIQEEFDMKREAQNINHISDYSHEMGLDDLGIRLPRVLKCSTSILVMEPLQGAVKARPAPLLGEALHFLRCVPLQEAPGLLRSTSW